MFFYETIGKSWLAPLLRPMRPIVREVLALSLFVNLIALAVPVFVLQVYDRVVFHAGLTTLQGLVIGMAILLVFDFILRQTRSRVMQTVALRLDAEVGKRLFDKIMNLPLATLEKRPVAYWQQAFRDADTVRNTLSGSSAVLLADLPFVVLFIGLIFVIAAPVAWVLLVALGVFLVMAWRAAAVVNAATDEERQAALQRDALMAETLMGRNTIKALALERAVRPAWEERTATTIESAIKRGAVNDTFVNLAMVMTLTTTVAMTAVGALAIIDQRMTIGSLIAANMLSGRLFSPLNQLVGGWRSFKTFRQSVERLGELFDEAEERRESALALERPKGRITLDDVSFVYEGSERPALSNIRLDILPGGMTAVMGRKGSGKTTLLKLILGLYKPAEGRVLLDSADISQFTRTELALWIGYAPQETVLFAGSIRDNIAQPLPEADDEVIRTASERAGLHALVVDLPDGYATQVGESGQRLSGGMRQRLAIARALVHDPPVLLLDEPSGNLDREAEHALSRTLHDLGKTRTIVLVTHSPTLLSACRSVAVLDKGRIAAAGSARDVLPRLFGPQRSAEPVGSTGTEATEDPRTAETRDSVS